MKQLNRIMNAPEWLSKEAKQVWSRIAQDLHSRGQLKVGTFDLVASLCHSYAVYRAAVAKLEQEGQVIETATGARKVNPWSSIEKQQWEIFVRGLKELGVCESSVCQPNDVDPFLQFKVKSELR